MTALAAVLTGPRTFELREVELPSPGPAQLLVDVVACGVCGSNLHDWEAPACGVLGAPGAVGHEVSARVVAAGERVGIAPGAIIAVQPSAVSGCQACSACQEGAWWFCAAKHAPGPYGFATQMLVPSSAALVMPASLPADLAALVEPVACGVHAVRHCWTAREEGRLDGLGVVVLGAGMLGLSAVAAARWAGAGDIAVVARHQHQAEAAARLGADEVLDAGRDDLAAELRERAPSLVIEAVGGTGETLDLAVAVARRRGEVVVLGAFPGRVPVEVGRLLNREIRLYGAVSYARRDGVDDFAIAAELVSERAGAFAGLATHRFALEEIDAAFAVAADKRSGCVRALVTGSAQP